MIANSIFIALMLCLLRFLNAADVQTYLGLDVSRLDCEEPQFYNGLSVQQYLGAQASDSQCERASSPAAPISATPLPPSSAVLMPKAWLGRTDIFNASADFECLLRKVKPSGALPLRNNTSNSVSLHIRATQFAEEGGGPEVMDLDLTIAAGRMINFLNFNSYDAIRLNSGSDGFLNFSKNGKKYEVSVESDPVLLFPRPLNPFEFTPCLEDSNLSSNLLEQKKIEQYKSHVKFMRYVCAQEGIDPDVLYLQRKRMYDACKLESIMGMHLPFIPKIPLNLFSIWLTNPEKPRDPANFLLDLAIASSKVNSRKDGWNHYFLVQDPILFPESVRYLRGSGVSVVKFSDLLGKLELQSEFDQAVSDNKFGMASDILRVEALYKMGGGYLDIDLALLHSLKPYFYMLDSMMAIEPMSEFAGNAFMASSARHPIMAEMIRLIRRNFDLKRRGDSSFYSAKAVDNGFNTIVQTGPCVTTVAFYNAAGRDGKMDVLMPPEAFYPAVSLDRPEFEIPKFADPINVNSAMVHEWRTTWMNNGSKG